MNEVPYLYNAHECEERCTRIRAQAEKARLIQQINGDGPGWRRLALDKAGRLMIAVGQRLKLPEESIMNGQTRSAHGLGAALPDTAESL